MTDNLQAALPELPEWNGEFMTESEFAEAAQAYALEAVRMNQPAGGEAVAEVGPGWTLRLVGATPIAEFFRRHPELRIGTKLYTHPAAQAPAVRVADEMANLRSAIMRLDGQSRRDTLVAYRKLEAALGQGRGS